MPLLSRHLCWQLFVALALALVASGAMAQTACGALLSLNLEELPDGPAKILSAATVQVPSEGLSTVSINPIPFNPHAVSVYCRVTGYVGPQSQFELVLPDPSQWNGKFFFSACAGFCGSVMASSCYPGLAKGYASVTSNGGHVSQNGFDGVWAANEDRLQRDFGYRSNHLVTVAAKRIVEAYYGSAPRRSYIAGCSKGGQATLMEALRYPDDFDGLITVAPVYDYSGKSVVHASWIAQANSNGNGGNVIDNAATDLIHRSVLARCDANDGVVDGVVGDPYSCQWKPSDLACKGGNGNECLSTAQVSALNKIYSPPTNSRGQLLFPTGNTLGAEIGEWKGWVNGMRSANAAVAQQYMRYLLAERPSSLEDSNPLTFDFDRDLRRLERARSINDTTSVDFDAFFARGGKILMWHGLADSGIPAGSSIHYYLRVLERLGGRERTEASMRLFLLPGVTHCLGGDGSDRADTLTALDNWVERGLAPAWLDTTRSVNGAETRLRRVYAYPKVTRFNGVGSVDDPANWSVGDPWIGRHPPRPWSVAPYMDPYPRIRYGGRLSGDNEPDIGH